MDFAAIIIGVLMQIIGMLEGKLPPKLPLVPEDSVLPTESPIVTEKQVQQDNPSKQDDLIEDGFQQAKGAVEEAEDKINQALDQNDPADHIQDGFNRAYDALEQAKNSTDKTLEKSNEVINNVQQSLLLRQVEEDEDQQEASDLQSEIEDLQEVDTDNPVDPNELADQMEEEVKDDVKETVENRVKDVQSRVNDAIDNALDSLIF